MAHTDDETLPSEPRGVVGPTDATVARVPGEDPPPPPSRAGDEGVAPERAQVSRAGDYVVAEALAEGGFGVVYRGEHAALGAKVAVKVLHAELASHPDVLLRFEREVEVMRRVQHPNVVQVLDFGRLADGRPYFVMELLEGQSLEQHLRARGRLPQEEALALLEPLCGALEVAHAQGIVHRDIKPSNVFLCEQGGGVRVVLLDFGVAKLLDAPGPALTSSRQVVGSLSCMAPEQLLGRPVDARTDIYALGALTHTMLTGEPPFTGSTYSVLRQLHLFASPPRPSARARVSPAVDDVVLQALSKEPADRQRSVGELLAGLRAAIAGPRPFAQPGRAALGIYVEVQADPGALEEPDDRLLDDFESILPFALSELTSAGFAAAVEAGTSALLTIDRPADEAGDCEVRRRAVTTSLSLKRRLDARNGQDPRVHVRFCIHAGELVTGPDGALAGGDLLEIAGWVPDGTTDGIFASAEVLDGLGIAAQPAPASRGASALLKVVEPQRRG